MGSYMLSLKEIQEALSEALDNLEGDFTDKMLLEVLEVMKLYPYVCDKIKSEKKYLLECNKL
jgi:hypothetical protein